VLLNLEQICVQPFVQLVVDSNDSAAEAREHQDAGNCEAAPTVCNYQRLSQRHHLEPSRRTILRPRSKMPHDMSDETVDQALGVV
jgi:hypothetical protein